MLSSVLARVSIPVMHSAAALGRLAQLEYSGPTSLFIRVLLDKKYALPYKVLDRVWEHFVRLANEHKTLGTALPVLWHQSLLVFVQRCGDVRLPSFWRSADRTLTGTPPS